MHWLLELATAVAAKRFSVKERSQNRRYDAVGSGKSGRNGIDCRGRRFVVDESPTKFGCNVPGGGGVGGNDTQNIVQILRPSMPLRPGIAWPRTSFFPLS